MLRLMRNGDCIEIHFIINDEVGDTINFQGNVATMIQNAEELFRGAKSLLFKCNFSNSTTEELTQFNAKLISQMQQTNVMAQMLGQILGHGSNASLNNQGHDVSKKEIRKCPGCNDSILKPKQKKCSNCQKIDEGLQKQKPPEGESDDTVKT